MAQIELPPDFREFLRLLNAHQVEYVIIGGYAVAHHGHPRATQDLDVFVALGRDNAERLVAVLHDFGFDLPEVMPQLFLDPARIVRLGEPPMRLEILTDISGVTFDECRAGSETIDLDGLPVRVIGLADLRRNKRASGRPKDLADLENLPD